MIDAHAPRTQNRDLEKTPLPKGWLLLLGRQWLWAIPFACSSARFTAP